ncbi:MAG: hypothetical protein KDI28_00785 [Pseudomonadales bacterium]|nr:hypothetical protein [Pseudomonadales bacterium]MCP5358678.1 hypothetical protein [Pseudomonadales bacterium]
MNSDKYSAYCKEHVKEFRDELREEASHALTSWPGKSAGTLLILSSVLTYLNLSNSGNPYAFHTLFTYAAPILLIFLFPVSTLLFSSLDKHSRTVLDLICITTIFGFCMTLKYVFTPQYSLESQNQLFLALSGQINFSLLMVTAFSYHTRFRITFVRNVFFTVVFTAMVYLVNAAYLASNLVQVVQGFLAGSIFSWMFFTRIQTRFYYKSIDADTRQHLYNQLSKLVYPHQLEMIKSGDQLENTMPVEKGRAIINVFDVQRSSEIKHERTKSFFLDVFRAFSQICMMGYQHNPLKSRAFRLKETGDGFISSIGYPFLADDPNSLADHAISTALIMFRAFNNEVRKFDYATPIKGAMGLAFNSVQGTFQSSGIKSYDLFGEALIQAYRYEEIRKHPPVADIIQRAAEEQGLEYFNILIIQEVIYNSLKPEYKALFQEIKLQEGGVIIRQDMTAQSVYFHVLE